MRPSTSPSGHRLVGRTAREPKRHPFIDFGPSYVSHSFASTRAAPARCRDVGGVGRKISVPSSSFRSYRTVSSTGNVRVSSPLFRTPRTPGLGTRNDTCQWTTTPQSLPRTQVSPSRPTDRPVRVRDVRVPWRRRRTLCSPLTRVVGEVQGRCRDETGGRREFSEVCGRTLGETGSPSIDRRWRQVGGSSQCLYHLTKEVESVLCPTSLDSKFSFIGFDRLWYSNRESDFKGGVGRVRGGHRDLSRVGLVGEGYRPLFDSVDL